MCLIFPSRLLWEGKQNLFFLSKHQMKLEQNP